MFAQLLPYYSQFECFIWILTSCVSCITPIDSKNIQKKYIVGEKYNYLHLHIPVLCFLVNATFQNGIHSI